MLENRLRSFATDIYFNLEHELIRLQTVIANEGFYYCPLEKLTVCNFCSE